MNYNSQTNGSRKKIVSSQETSNRHNGNKKSVRTSDKLSNSKLAVDPLEDAEKLSTTIIKNTKRSSTQKLLQRQSVDSPSVSRLKISADRPIIDQSVNPSINIKPKKKLTSEIAPVLQKSNADLSKKKFKKQYSNDDDKRGISTIYMPRKSSNTAKGPIESIKKDRSGSTVKNKDNRSNNISANPDKQQVPSRERKKSRTLSPSEIKMLKTNVKPSEKISSDSSSLNKASNQRESSSECDYEDDFEDYESDFQDCTDSDEAEASQVSDESEAIANEPEPEPIELKTQKVDKQIVTNITTRKYSEEEHMLDSGHYELQEARRRAARIDLITAKQNARAPISTMERSMYSGEKPSEIKSLPSSADEGFEDGRSGDFAKSLPIPGTVHSVISTNRDEVPDEKRIKSTRRCLSRGEQLLQMIQLDVVEWSLYESTPIAYEEFIHIHGRMNTRQISTQTNDDNLSVEIQTDEIECKNMWTQFPITCRSVLNNNDDINLFTAELAGVGSDENYMKSRPEYDILELNEFLSAAGNVILALLESKQLSKTNVINTSADVHGLPFGEATIKLSIANVTFLSGRPVTMIRYSDISSKILLTIHDRVDEEVETSSNENFYVTDCCIGCVWNILDPSRPVKLFYSCNNITACRFHPTNYNVIFGGLEDGSMSLWDLGENESYHRRVIDKENNAEWTLRCVTFNSSGNLDAQTQSKIVALAILSEIKSNATDDVGTFMPVQICSLDEEGGCIVWSVLRNFEGSSSTDQDLGQSWWGKLRLTKSYEIPINLYKGIHSENFMRDFRDINVDSVDTDNLYIAANISQILHVTRFGTKPIPALFLGIDCVGGTTCIEICPFGQPFFLVGCEDGTVRLYSSTVRKPLLELKNLHSSASIRTIQWSKSKPLTIYVLDDEAKIHVWNLSQSNNTPEYSIIPDKYAHVVSMQLSPWRTNHDMLNQYMALGLDNGTVEIHKFNKEFHNSHEDDLLSELKIFFSYLEVY